MSITSYAQNFEDVMLWRALGHIPNGFYIDVGAQHPVIDSVSKAFYEHGWRGVHVEATPVYATLVRADRPDEIVLQVALSDKPGSLTFYEIPDTGLSTGDASIAEHHRSRGYNVVETVVPCITLADVFTQVGQQDVHWLKIDVEGMEALVLAGWGDCPVRPWVLVVESTYPNSQVETHQEWEGMVLARGYVHTYFDGLSRYYVLADRPDLAQKFNTPPNIFDAFLLAPSVPYNAPTRHLMQQKEQRYQDELTGERANAAHELQTVRETLAQREDALGAHISQLQHQVAIASEQQTASLAARDIEAVQQIETLRRQHTEREQAIAQQLQTSQEERLRLQQEQMEREQTLLAQANQAKQEVENLLRIQVQREQAVAEKLEAVRSQAAQESAELARSLTKQQHALHSQHTAREQALGQQLEAGKQERIRREQALLEQANQAKQEVENLLRTQVQREHAVAEKLEAVRSQAAQENAELARSLAEQQHALHSQHIAHEQALNQRLEAGQEQHNKLQQERIKREQTLLEQTSQAKQEVENLLRTQAQREREVLAQLLAVQQQATREKAELTRSHAEKERELGSQQAQREKALTQQLHAHQQELRNLQKDRVKREQEAAQEKADLARRHSEQEHALLRQQADREKAHSQQLRTQQEEFHRLQLEQSKREQALLEEHSQTRQLLQGLRDTVAQREQEVLAQLQASQQQAAQEKTELLQKQSEQEQALHRQHSEREAALTQQLQELQQLLQRQQEDWAQLENALNNEIATLQNETQTLHQAQQLQAQQHSLEISTKLDEHTRLLEACAALKAQLQAEIQSGQHASLHLRQSLAEVQQSLATTHASLTWRMTAPLRTLASFIAPKKNLDSASPIVAAEATDAIMTAAAALQSINVQKASIEPIMPATTEAANSHTPAHEMGEGVRPHAIMPSISESQPINVQHASIEPIMFPFTQATAPALASTLDELLACHEQQFVRCAFQTLLGRDPDPEGLGYYLGRLRTGFSKMRIVAQLRLSKEGKAHAAKLPGLDIAVQRHQKGQYPLIGWLFRRLNGGEGNHPTERKLRSIENQLFLLSDESKCRFNQLETALTGLHHLVVQQTQSVVAALGSMPLVIPSAASITPIQSPEPDGLKQVSPRARTIYFQLKTAAAIHAGRAA
jgi:FkbM family methyltransferase